MAFKRLLLVRTWLRRGDLTSDQLRAMTRCASIRSAQFSCDLRFNHGEDAFAEFLMLPIIALRESLTVMDINRKRCNVSRERSPSQKSFRQLRGGTTSTLSRNNSMRLYEEVLEATDHAFSGDTHARPLQRAVRWGLIAQRVLPIPLWVIQRFLRDLKE